jgi:P2X purinoceptor 4
MTNCRPDYRFRRLDNPHAKIAPGWNFRHSDYYGNNARTLYKSYGILFVVDVQGSAGKFNFIPFFLNVGAGLALLGIATVICDIIVLYCMKESDVYRDKKYLLVKGKDAFAVYRRQEDEDGEDVGGKEDVVVETDEEGTAADSNTVVQRRVGRLAAAAASS